MVHVFEGFFLSQIIFTTVRFASKLSVYILSLLLLTFKRLTGKYNGMGSKILQSQRKSFGEKTNFFTNIRDPKLVNLFVAFFFSSSSRRFYHLWGKKIIVRFGLSSCITIFKAFCLFVFSSFFRRELFWDLLFFSLSLKHQKVVMLVKTFKNVITIFN